MLVQMAQVCACAPTKGQLIRRDRSRCLALRCWVAAPQRTEQIASGIAVGTSGCGVAVDVSSDDDVVVAHFAFEAAMDSSVEMADIALDGGMRVEA